MIYYKGGTENEENRHWLKNTCLALEGIQIYPSQDSKLGKSSEKHLENSAPRLESTVESGYIFYL